MDRGRVLVLGSLSLFLILVSIPLFFEIYRFMAFNIAPRDDYGPYLQALLGEGGQVPGAPMVYRIFSVAIAAPFYYLLPAYSFTKLVATDPQYLRATEALAAVSFLSIIASMGVIFLICRKRLGATTKSSLIVALLSMLFSSFISQEGVDPICILIISTLIYLIDQPRWFIVLMLVSIGFNEKIAILFTIILSLRLVIGRDRSILPQLGASVVAALVYFAIRLVVNAPGWENQMTPSSYLTTLTAMIPVVFSAKGLVTNILPTLIIAALALLDLSTVSRLQIDSPVFRRSDAAVFVVMLLIGMAIDMQYTVGRLVMFTYPLYLPMLSRQLDEWFPDRGSSSAIA